MNEDAYIDSYYESLTDLDDRGWPGDGSGMDDLADYNANEADDYANEGDDGGADYDGPEDFGYFGDEALCGE